MAAERQAEKAQREALAARRRQQQKFQSSVDEERKNNAQRKMEKVQGREWDAQKEEADWNHPDKPTRGRASFEGRGGRGGGRGGRGRGRGGFNGGRPGRQDAPKSPGPSDPNDKSQVRWIAILHLLGCGLTSAPAHFSFLSWEHPLPNSECENLKLAVCC